VSRRCSTILEGREVMKVGMSQKHTFEMEADPSQSLGGHIDISASLMS
jgi:hypothetical protein